MIVVSDKGSKGGRGGSGLSAEEYLKYGEDNQRDKKDKRLTLQGDLKTWQRVTEMGYKKGYKETYRSVVLSFGEDYIDDKTLENISKDFEKQYMSGYKQDEYCLYSEAHLPKIKNKYDNNGNIIATRKPHIHIMIATYSPKLDKSLTLGTHKQRLEELKLWKKVTENKYGLSPVKQNAIQKQSTKLKNTNINSQNKKQRLESYQEIIKENIEDINNVEDIKKTLRDNVDGIEEIKQSSEKAQTAYLSIKLESQKTSDRLKGVLFSDNTFNEGKEQLQNKDEKNARNLYYEVQEPRENSNEDLEKLAEYKTKRQLYIEKSVKWKREQVEQVPQAEQKKESDYTDTEKEKILKSRVLSNRPKEVDILNARKASEIQKNSEIPTLQEQEIKELELDEEQLKELPKAPKTQKNSSILNREIEKTKESLAMKTDKEYHDYKKSLNPHYVFENLNIDKSKYGIWKKQDEYRIKCGNRNLNTHDFLTKEMNLSWNEAKVLMDKSYKNQLENTRAKEEQKPNKDKMSYQQKVLYSKYKSRIEHNLKGYYVNVQHESVNITSKAKNINIRDNGTEITGSGANNQEQVKLMLDIAEAKGWNLRTIELEGSKEFIKEANKQIEQRAKIKKQEQKAKLAEKRAYIREASKQDFHSFLDGNQWELDKAKSSKNYPVFRDKKSGDKILLFKDKNDIQRYMNVNNDSDKGTIKDFMEKRGIKSLDEQVRFLQKPKQTVGNIELQSKDSETSRFKAMAKYNEYKELGNYNEYLSKERGLNTSSYEHYQALKLDERGNIVAPMYSYSEETDRYIHTGNNKKLKDYYAPKGKQIKDLNEGNKGIGLLPCKNKPKNIVIAESSIDGMSYLEAKKLNPKETIIVSTNGQTNNQAIKDIATLANKKFSTAKVSIAMDNDEKGKSFTKQIKNQVPRAKEDKPIQKDWNEQLKKDKEYLKAQRDGAKESGNDEQSQSRKRKRQFQK